MQKFVGSLCQLRGAANRQVRAIGPTTASKRIAWLFFFAASAAIVWMSLSPTVTPGSVGIWDKLAHVIAYATVGCLAGLGTTGRRQRQFVAIVLVVFAAVLEVSQGLVPNRSPDFFDFLTSILGIAVGHFFALAIVAMRR